MKIAPVDNPVRADWFFAQGLRLDAGPYVSGALGVRKRLEAMSTTMRLDSVTMGHNGGIYNGPMFRRVYVTDPEHSVPFLGSKDMQTADLTSLPRLKKSDATSARLAYLRLVPGMTLISCSGFNAGRRAYARPDMAGIWSSQDILKVQADPEKIPHGYLYAFLASTFGEALVRGSVYGSAVKHIEPHHLIDLPVPRFGQEFEQRVHELIEESARLRANFQALLSHATYDLYESVGLPDLVHYRWHGTGRDVGFEVDGLTSISLRAMNYTNRARQLKERIASTEHRLLGDLCVDGLLRYGPIFKRIDSEYEAGGALLVGQRQAWWVRPEDGRVISPRHTPEGVFLPDETVLIGGHGMPSESGLFGRAALVTGRWREHAYSQDFLRVHSSDPEVPGAYLLAYLRSEPSLRIFRSMLTGGGPQSIHLGLAATHPVPMAATEDRERIADTVRQAYRDRDQADVLEDEALALLTAAIEGAEG